MDVNRNLKLRRLCGDAGHDPQVWPVQCLKHAASITCMHFGSKAVGWPLQALAALYPAVEGFRLNLAALIAPQFPVSVLGSVLYQCVNASERAFALWLPQDAVTPPGIGRPCRQRRS